MTPEEYIEIVNIKIEKVKKDSMSFSKKTAGSDPKSYVLDCLTTFNQTMEELDNVENIKSLLDSVKGYFQSTQHYGEARLSPNTIASECNALLNKVTERMHKTCLTSPNKISRKILNKIKTNLLRRNHPERKDFMALIDDQIQFKTSKQLSWASLIISIVALLAVLGFSILDWQGDKEWQKDQIETLQRIEKAIPAPPAPAALD